MTGEREPRAAVSAEEIAAVLAALARHTGREPDGDADRCAQRYGRWRAERLAALRRTVPVSRVTVR